MTHEGVLHISLLKWDTLTSLNLSQNSLSQEAITSKTKDELEGDGNGYGEVYVYFLHGSQFGDVGYEYDGRGDANETNDAEVMGQVHELLLCVLGFTEDIGYLG